MTCEYNVTHSEKNQNCDILGHLIFSIFRSTHIDRHLINSLKRSIYIRNCQNVFTLQKYDTVQFWMTSKGSCRVEHIWKTCFNKCDSTILTVQFQNS